MKAGFFPLKGFSFIWFPPSHVVCPFQASCTELLILDTHESLLLAKDFSRLSYGSVNNDGLFEYFTQSHSWSWWA
jgi:hypothetical protein